MDETFLSAAYVTVYVISLRSLDLMGKGLGRQRISGLRPSSWNGGVRTTGRWVMGAVGDGGGG